MNINKEFMPSVANTIGTNLAHYKMIQKNQFACNLMHVGRDKSVVVSKYSDDEPSIISPAYKIFQVQDNSVILPDFLMLNFLRSEFDRLGWFYTDSSIRGSLDWSKFCNIKIPVPSIEIQKKIVDIYQFFNDRIELKERINNNLEELLSNIYENMLSSENLSNNWKMDKLENYVDFVTGVEPGSDNYYENWEKGLVPFLRVGNLNSNNSLVFVEKDLTKNRIIFPKDIIISLDGSVGIVKIGFYGSYSTGIRKLKIKDKKINKPFLYCLLKSQHIQEIINKYATGTTILHAGKSIKHMDFILPDTNTLENFYLKCNPIFLEILKNQTEIKKLTDLKNLLLPKLILGEFDLSNFSN